MVYILIGGPRSRQLVDELPSGYRAEGHESDRAGVVVLEDLVAAPAVWDIPEDSWRWPARPEAGEA